ncbi:hypothetical protein [Lentibacillus sp. Marseille-P4043]|uniref:hypothetical protein n=1 Tax=Lentibacillus sp. Marseille-P4043 TaxID=2040293 RepID=UPI000D0BA269|nr:hypothetical protein [Lentibacillus sp. Marseille-P4043]
MFSFRGDAHKTYLTLKRQKDIHTNKILKETAEIKSFYKSLDSEILKLVYYRMVKEQSGTGIIPIFVTAIPWLLFLFSNTIQDFLFRNNNLIWIGFVSLYLIILTGSAILHFKEKAWSALHIEIITDVLNERD